MPEDNIDKIIAEAKAKTDAKYADKVKALTSLSDKDVDALMNAGLKQSDVDAVAKEIADATKDNNAKAEAIKKISKGVETLVFLAGRFI
jgi:Holliday junction resolvasome RuvABC DNA-binding subunit